MVAHEILVSAQGPLVLALGLWFGPGLDKNLCFKTYLFSFLGTPSTNNKRNKMKMEKNKTENERGTFKKNLKFMIRD